MRCGTRQGYDTHKNLNEPPCKWCVKAVTNPAPAPAPKPKPKPKPKPRPVKAKREPGTPRQAATCGTNAGYKRHKRDGQDACLPCKDAAATYARERYQPSTREHAYAPCGTEGGRTRHKREGTPVCDPCRTIYNDASRRRHKQRKAANV